MHLNQASFFKKKGFWVGACVALLSSITAFYRFYQPLTHPALLQFDTFDWMTRSQELLTLGAMTAPTVLWVFPTINAFVAQMFRIDLFSVHLYSGSVLTTLNIVVIAATLRLLWPRRYLPMFLGVLLYALNSQLLARSINYLPETMSYSFGLLLVFFYVYLHVRRNWKVIPAIIVLTYLYFHLHQSGLNFVVFSAATLLAYCIWVLPGGFRRRVIAVSGFIGIAGAAVAISTPLQQQFLFFLKGSANADIAFQGTPIPYSQILTDYSLLFVAFLVFGAVRILHLSFNKALPAGVRLSFLLLLSICACYFAFLYALPNLGLYSLIPWRFYTWFSLYGIFVATAGAVVIFDQFKRRFTVVAVGAALLLVTFVHGSFISDTMFTADRAVLTSMRNAPIQGRSTILTTNANYLQTKWAMVGRDVAVYQVGPEVFRAGSISSAVENVRQYVDGRSVYILISKFQLRQRPASIDYWRNSAIFDMDIRLFTSGEAFNVTFEDSQILLVQLVDSVL